MKSMKKIFNTCLVLSILLVSSCSDITDINENPNGVDPNTADPNFVLSTVMTETGKSVAGRYTSPLGAFVQHTQKDSWSDNDYDWEGSGWTTYYSALRNAELSYIRSIELGWEWHQGVSMVLKAMQFGKLADFYGDVPYTEALKGAQGGDFIYPKYDSQESVYKGIIEDLKAASVLLSKDQTAYEGVNANQDIFYGGDADKWMRLANSLALRYYMRLSEVDPGYAQAGVTEMLSKPLISNLDEECNMSYVGVSSEDSWPSNGINTTRSDFTRIKPCSTFSNKLADLEDPRRHIWFAAIEMQIKVVLPGQMPGGAGVDDEIVDGVRYINAASMNDKGYKIYNPETWYNDRAVLGLTMIDTNSVYVGIPVSNQDTDPYTYNLNPIAERGGFNQHVSEMNEQFNQVSGEFLLARIFSSAEVHFLMAEAAVKGWGSNAEAHYLAGIMASFDAWGIGDQAADYMGNDGVVFDGSLEKIMEQKWIAGFTAPEESYFDWRRTGLPDLQTGPFAKSDVIPVRFPYDDSDRFINVDNYNAALGNLESTSHTDDVPGYGVDSPWSKNWAQQGVSEPW